MFLFKRNNGFYYICYNTTEGSKRNISTKAKTKTDAFQFLVRFEKELDKRNSEEVENIYLNKFLFEFLVHAELTRTEKTIKAYKNTFGLIQKQFGNIAIGSIINIDVRRYLDYRVSKSSNYAARKDLINLKAVFKHAIEKNYIKVNPCSGIKQYKLPERQPLYFTKTDYDKLLNVIDNKEFKGLVILAANTGMRQMELLNLTWKQINLETKNILLDNRNHITKSKKIPINDNIYKMLLDRKAESTGDNLFSYEGRNKDVMISMKMKSYILKAGLNPKLHFHSLRHSFASWLVQSGVSIYLVSKLLGHSDIKTTEIYSHLRQDDLLDSVNCLHN